MVLTAQTTSAPERFVRRVYAEPILAAAKCWTPCRTNRRPVANAEIERGRELWAYGRLDAAIAWWNRGLAALPRNRALRDTFDACLGRLRLKCAQEVRAVMGTQLPYSPHFLDEIGADGQLRAAIDAFEYGDDAPALSAARRLAANIPDDQLSACVVAMIELVRGDRAAASRDLFEATNRYPVLPESDGFYIGDIEIIATLIKLHHGQTR